MAKITSDQWGIILGAGDNAQPHIIKASQRKNFPDEATWIAGDQLAHELQNNPALHRVKPSIEKLVQDFEQRTHSSFSAPQLSDTEAKAVIDKMLGDVLQKNTLSSRLIRFALTDPDLKVNIIPDSGVQAYGDPEEDGQYLYVKGFCDEHVGHTNIYVCSKPVYPSGLPPEEGIKWLTCEELLHHAMKRIYKNNCEVYPTDNNDRFVILDKAINADRKLINSHYHPLDIHDDDSVNVDQKFSHESASVQERFREDFDFPEEVYAKWKELYCEWPVKLLTMEAVGELHDPSKIEEPLFKDETVALRYPHLMQYVNRVIEEDFDRFEKDGKLPDHSLEHYLKTLSFNITAKQLDPSLGQQVIAHITSDQWGIIIGTGDNAQPKIIRESERKDFPADATWIGSDQLTHELQTNIALQSMRSAIEKLVQEFQQRTHSNFYARKLSDEEAQAIVYQEIGDVLKKDTLAAKLLRFSLADPKLSLYVIDDRGVQAYGHPEEDGGYKVFNGFCDADTGKHAVYMAIRSPVMPNEQPTVSDTRKSLICEELLHYAMKRMYDNNCEVYPADNHHRRVILDKAIKADIAHAKRQLQLADDAHADDALPVDQKLNHEPEKVVDRFREDFDFVARIYGNDWKEIYCEFPVKMLTMHALGVWSDPAYTVDKLSASDTLASRYPNLEKYVNTIISKDLAHYEKTGQLPNHPLEHYISTLPFNVSTYSEQDLSGNVIPITASMAKENAMTKTHSHTQRERLQIIRATTDFSKLMQPGAQDLRSTILGSYYPLTQAMIARDTSSAPNAKINRPTAGKVRNLGMDEPGMADQIADATKKLGIETHVIPIDDEAIRKQFGEHSIVICRVGPKKDGGILLTGHTDVVPAKIDPKQPYNPFLATPEGDKIHGRGTVDMKAANAAILTTLALMKQHEAELKEPYYAVFTPGEETWDGGAEKARMELDRMGIRPKLVIIPEADTPHKIQTGHAGFVSYDVIAPGKQGGTAEIRAAAEWISQIDTLADTIGKNEQWKTPAFNPPYPTLNHYLFTNQNFAGRNTVPANAALNIMVGQDTDIKALTDVVQRLDRKIKERAEIVFKERKKTADDPDPGIVLKKMDDSHYQLQITGVANHSATPWLGVNAYKYWAEAVKTLGDMSGVGLSLPSEQYGDNVKLGVSYRCHTDEQAQSLKESITEATQASFKQYGAEQPNIVLIDNRPPMLLMNMDTPEVKKFTSIVSDVVGQQAKVLPATGAGDGAYYYKLAGSPPVVYWFPHGEDRHHMPDEFIKIDDFVNGFKGLLGISAEICGVDILKALSRQNVAISADDLAHTYDTSWQSRTANSPVDRIMTP